MNARLAKVLVNGLPCAAALVALLPLLWMLSVSFMASGGAGSLQPPLLPAHATLANYRELFAHAGMAATCSTASWSAVRSPHCRWPAT